jgi:GT2 family glycosyltransferase
MISPTVPLLPQAISLTAESEIAGEERLSILLVNYNGMRYLGPCLESIRLHAPPGTQVILVDNASTDGSLEAARASFPWLEIVRSDQNLGFAGGNNLAGRSARGRFLLLLNTDTLLLEPIAPVVDWLESHVSYGALTINMLDGDRISRACTGRFPSPARLAVLRSMLISPERYGTQEAYDVDWVQGSFLLTRADVWHVLNGLDEGFFMYGEDIDFCKRMQEAGLACAYLPRWKYVHWGGFASSRFPELVCSFAIYVERHMKGIHRLLCRGVLFAGCLLRATMYRIRGIIQGREFDRIEATNCWRAFKVIVQRLE